MNKVLGFLAVLIALGVGFVGGFYAERYRATTTLESTKLAMQKKIDQAESMAKAKIGMTQEGNAIVMISKSGYTTDTKGMTLYIFDKDTKGVSTCYGTCAVNWPPFLATVVPTTLPTHLTTIKRTDGNMQYAWDSKPLYYYIGDKKVGDITGDGVGGVWHLAK